MSKGTSARAQLLGRLGKDPTFRQTNGGKRMANLSLACTSGFGNSETTSWFDVVVFDEKKADVLERFVKKGSRILVGGELRVRKWTDQNQQTRYSTELVVGFDGYLELVDSASDREPGTSTRSDAGQPSHRPSPGGGTGGGFGGFDSDLDDDVPF